MGTTGCAIGAQIVHRVVLLGIILLVSFFLSRDLYYIDGQLGCEQADVGKSW